MSVTVNDPFQKRLRRIVRRHNRMANGVKHKVTKQGLIVAEPRLVTPRFPYGGVVLVLVVAFLFKAYVYADLGGANYNARVDTLSGGSTVEQAGAWVMQADPVTVIVGDVLRDLLG